MIWANLAIHLVIVPVFTVYYSTTNQMNKSCILFYYGNEDSPDIKRIKTFSRHTNSTEVPTLPTRDHLAVATKAFILTSNLIRCSAANLQVCVLSNKIPPLKLLALMLINYKVVNIFHLTYQQPAQVLKHFIYFDGMFYEDVGA